MLELKILTLVFALKNLLIPNFKERSCSGFRFEKRGYKIVCTGTMPDSLSESSGLEKCREGQSYWTLGDGGTKSQLYEIDSSGKVLSVLPLHQIKNRDWEGMAKDKEENIYVGDFGNNTNTRKNLCIYKINANENDRIDTIFFRYPDQANFPPEKKQKNFDCEGMFWYKDSLYLFSKNRGNNWMNIYRLPDDGGNYTAAIHQKIYVSSQITAADINPDHSLVALLAYGRIYFFRVTEFPSLKLKPCFKRRFNSSGQSEALVFINQTDLLISNEQRQLFLMQKENRKKKQEEGMRGK